MNNSSSSGSSSGSDGDGEDARAGGRAMSSAPRSVDASFGVANIALSRLNHDLRSIQDVAEGAFGVVQCAVLDADGRRYAVKEMKKAIASEGDLQQRLQEVYALSACTCPYILRYYDAWVENRSLYVLTEWVDGGTAAQLPTPLAEVHVRALLHQMACALHYLHARGIAHYDIKPDNILVHVCAHNDAVGGPDASAFEQQSNMLFKLCDFGLSRQCSTPAPHVPGDECGDMAVYADTDDDDNGGAQAARRRRRDESAAAAPAATASATPTVATPQAPVPGGACDVPRQDTVNVCGTDGDMDDECDAFAPATRGGAAGTALPASPARTTAPPATTACGCSSVRPGASVRDDNSTSSAAYANAAAATAAAAAAAAAATAADVYALGVVCVTLMGGSANAVRDGVYSGPFATYSPSLQAVLRAMTARHPRSRPCALDVAIATLPPHIAAHAAVQQRRAELSAAHARLRARDDACV